MRYEPEPLPHFARCPLADDYEGPWCDDESKCICHEIDGYLRAEAADRSTTA